MSERSASAGERSVKLACEAVWKVFGPGAEAFLAGHGGQVDDGQLAGAGLIGAVRDASLEVYEGEIFIIMGLSGSGKSTLVRCMSRLIEPTAGRVVFEGQKLEKVVAQWLKENESTWKKWTQ